MVNKRECGRLSKYIKIRANKSMDLVISILDYENIREREYSLHLESIRSFNFSAVKILSADSNNPSLISYTGWLGKSVLSCEDAKYISTLDMHVKSSVADYVVSRHKDGRYRVVDKNLVKYYLGVLNKPNNRLKPVKIKVIKSIEDIDKQVLKEFEVTGNIGNLHSIFRHEDKQLIHKEVPYQNLMVEGMDYDTTLKIRKCLRKEVSTNYIEALLVNEIQGYRHFLEEVKIDGFMNYILKPEYRKDAYKLCLDYLESYSILSQLSV